MLMFGLCQAPVRSKNPAVHVVRFLLGQAFSYGIYTSPHTSNSWVGDNDDRFSSGPITTVVFEQVCSFARAIFETSTIYCSSNKTKV